MVFCNLNKPLTDNVINDYNSWYNLIDYAGDETIAKQKVWANNKYVIVEWVCWVIFKSQERSSPSFLRLQHLKLVLILKTLSPVFENFCEKLEDNKKIFTKQKYNRLNNQLPNPLLAKDF